MDRKIILNYIYNILYQLIKFGLSFILVPYTMGHLGEELLGVSDYANSIASWFFYIGVLGLNIYGNREIAKVRDNKDQLSKSFFELLSMQFIDMAIVLVLYILYTHFFVTDYRLIYFLICMTLLSYMFDISWFYAGVENFGIVTARNAAVKLIGVILIFTFVKGPEDLWKFVAINSGTDLFGQMMTFFGLKKYIHKVKYSIVEAYKNHLKGTFLLFVPLMAINLYSYLDQTLLGMLVEDKGEVSLYKVSQNFLNMFLFFVTSIGSVVMPRIANVYANNSDKEEVNNYLNSTFKLAIILSVPMVTALIFVSNHFFPWYLPGQYKRVIPLVQVSSITMMLVAMSNVFGMQYLVPTERNTKYTISVIVGAVVNLLVDLYTIPRWAGIGACIGRIVAELTVALVQWLFVRKEIHIHALSTFVKSLACSLIMGTLVYCLGNLLGSTLLTNLAQAIVGVLVYGGLLLLLKEPTVIGLYNKYVLKKETND